MGQWGQWEWGDRADTASDNTIRGATDGPQVNAILHVVLLQLGQDVLAIGVLPKSRDVGPDLGRKHSLRHSGLKTELGMLPACFWAMQMPGTAIPLTGAAKAPNSRALLTHQRSVSTYPERWCRTWGLWRLNSHWLLTPRTACGERTFSLIITLPTAQSLPKARPRPCWEGTFRDHGS